MVFSSILFLFLYLPLTLGIYYITPRRWRNLALLVLNLIFYGWGEPIYVLIMIFSILVDYSHGLLIARHRENDRFCRKVVASSVVINLGLLVFFKYYDFIVTNLRAVFPALSFLEPLGLGLPIGISFYTFQTMSYTIDVYRGDARAQKDIVSFGTFVTLFPQLIAGPIVKYKDVDDQLRERRESVEQFAQGVQTFVCGLAKKVLLANNIGALWEIYKTMDPSSLSVLGAWLGVLAFAFQIYFDFSGYSDMAIGLGRMLGFEFKINFDYPYISRSITEFWRRWHISLSSWFREYVYIPLGGNRKGLLKTYRNIFVVWMLTGIWHGASWNYVCWGLFFAVLLMVEKAFLLSLLKKAPAALGHIYTLFLVLISWALFANEDISRAFGYIGAMFGGGNGLWDSANLYRLVSYLPLLLILVLASLPLGKKLWLRLKPSHRWGAAMALCFLGLLLSTAYLVDASYNPFLYFRF